MIWNVHITNALKKLRTILFSLFELKLVRNFCKERNTLVNHFCEFLTLQMRIPELKECRRKSKHSIQPEKCTWVLPCEYHPVRPGNKAFRQLWDDVKHGKTITIKKLENEAFKVCILRKCREHPLWGHSLLDDSSDRLCIVL